jgi:hypothetical protein
MAAYTQKENLLGRLDHHMSVCRPKYSSYTNQFQMIHAHDETVYNFLLTFLLATTLCYWRRLIDKIVYAKLRNRISSAEKEIALAMSHGVDISHLRYYRKWSGHRALQYWTRFRKTSIETYASTERSKEDPSRVPSIRTSRTSYM